MPAASDLKSRSARLAEIIAGARAIVPFTGAGLSTESGIPDFRSPGGLWTRNKPIEFKDFMASREARREAWRRRFAMEAVFAAARPGTGHRVIASWIAGGRAPAVITQNVDDLQQQAGVAAGQVVEIHGNTTWANCLACGRRHELAWIRPIFEATGDPPACEACDGTLKTATILFGQPMPAEPMRRARELAENCDVFLVMGSSLTVLPAADLPRLAQQNGARLVILNREPTALDRRADLVVHGEIGTILDAVRDL